MNRKVLQRDAYADLYSAEIAMDTMNAFAARKKTNYNIFVANKVSFSVHGCV